MSGEWVAISVLGGAALVQAFWLVAVTQRLNEQDAKNDDARRHNAEQCSAAMVCAVRNAETCVKLAEQHKKLTELLGKAKP